MSGKIFPIKNNSACVFKWGWDTFRLYTGQSSSCHRVEPVFVPLDKMHDFHNTPEVLNDRKLMLEGQWPSGRGCEYCKDVESAGGVSDRMYQNSMDGLTPIDFDPTNQIQSVTPRILEIYLNNTCDLACLYCRPEYSSKINNELKKYGPLSTVNFVSMTPTSQHREYFDEMISWLKENYHHLQRFLIQGGEPFFQKEFYEMMDFLETQSNPNLEFSVNSNLNSKIKVYQDFVSRIKQMLINRKIKRFDITCSIDCWGPQQEFIRFGLSVDQWQKNFEFLLQHRWVYINTGHTITALSLKTMPDLQRLLNNYFENGYQLNQTFGYVDGPNQELYDPAIFGGEFFAEDLETMLEILPENTDQQKRVKQNFQGIATYISKSKPNWLRLKKLYVTLEEYDHRRGTDWKLLFPEINQFFLENGIINVV